MTPSPPHPAYRPPRNYASGAASLSPHRLQRRTPHRRSGQNRPRDHRSSDKIAAAVVPLPPTTPVNASPAQAAASSNPHSRQPPTRRPAGSFLGGFRTPALRARANSYDRAGIRNPTPFPPFEGYSARAYSDHSSNALWPAVDDTEGWWGSRERHIEGGHWLGETLQRQAAEVFECDYLLYCCSDATGDQDLAILRLRTQPSGEVAYGADSCVTGALGKADLSQRRVALGDARAKA